MRIILSPAKKMKYEDNGVGHMGRPVFIEDAEFIRDWLREKSFDELKKLWACNDKIVEQNIQRLSEMSNLSIHVSPAILSYDGIAFQYMAPTVFEDSMLNYVQKNLRILSGFYGVLKPMDGVVSYRLEMQAKAQIDGKKNLYEYWGNRLYEETRDESRVFINLASKEYSKCIEKYLQPEDTFITCTFAEEENGKLVQKGVYCKMARGEMVRYMAENEIQNPEEMKNFTSLGYHFREEYSSPEEYVFVGTR